MQALSARHTLRRTLVRGATMVGAASLAGCGASSQAGGGTAPPPSTAPVTIHMTELGTSTQQATDEQLPSFKSRFPHITVERDVMTGNNQEQMEKIQTLRASDQLPDTVHLFLEFLLRFAAAGTLLPLDDRVARDKLDTKAWFPDLIDIARTEGKLHALPMKGQAYGTALFYNQSMFEARGLALPDEAWTLDHLVRAAQQLTRREGTDTVQWGYSLGGIGAGFLIPNLRGFGGDVYSPDGKKAVLDSPATLEALQWHENLFTRERIAHPIANTPADFYTGKIAMIGRQLFGFGGSVVASVGDKFKWGSAIMPKHPKSGKRGGQFTGDMQTIARQTKAPDAAFELLKFITGKEFGVALGLQTRGSTTLGGRFDVYEDPRIVNNPLMPRAAQVAQVNSVKLIREPYSRPWNFRISEVEQVRDPAIAKILDGTAKADSSYLREINTQIQTILDKPRQT